MKIRKFIATTAREALREIRSELGEDAVILSNRKTEQGVEIVAMANDEMVRLSGDEMVRLSGTIKHGQKLKAKEQQAANVEKAAAVVVVAPVAAPVAGAITAEASILGEIKSMHSMLQKQIETLSWNNVQQRDPQRAGLLRRMLNSGFSTLLARQLLNKMPDGNEKGEAWIKQVLKRNLRVAGEDDDIVVKGGVYALIGPTGVGKTTTTAKLAARAVVRYGADKVALLTTDSYRIGAYEQLKIYGKILGVAVHAVKGADDLRLTLSALRHKHLVLIDTVGMGQRDERVSEQSDMFDATAVQRLLVLNSTSSGDTLEDVVRMYYSNKVIGCIATKLDEAVNLGALLDVVMRHRMVMYFMANGQRVPEDLHPVNIDVLLHRAFRAVEEKTPFTLEELEFPMMMAGAAESSASEVSYAL
ncbi:MAG: flagellar biosynthesis protein FlhF [Gallionella sp.]|nr:flagellar biosynthesis protein FlhF [Gallionella sp.]